MTKVASARRIIWAVDPFTPTAMLQRPALRAIQELTKDQTYAVEPVFQIGVGEADLNSEYIRQFKKHLEENGQKKLNKLTRALEIAGMQPLKILLSPTFSSHESAQYLTQYAHQSKTGLIVLSTHARKGVKRWLIGSYAESLAMVSEIPLLIVHPYWKKVADLKNVLFTADFSEESKDAYKSALEFVKLHKCRLILYHKFNYPNLPVGDYIYFDYEIYEKLCEETIASSKRQLNQMAEAGRAQRIEVDEIFDQGRWGTFSQSVLEYVKKAQCIVAIGSHVGRVKGLMLGSSGRKLIRELQVPVWIIRSPQIGTSEQYVKTGSHIMKNRASKSIAQDGH